MASEPSCSLLWRGTEPVNCAETWETVENPNISILNISILNSKISNVIKCLPRKEIIILPQAIRDTFSPEFTQQSGISAAELLLATLTDTVTKLLTLTRDDVNAPVP